MRIYRSTLAGIAFGAILAMFAAQFADAQAPTIDQVLNQLEQVRSFSGVSISPDGKWVSWIESDKSGGGTSAYLLDWQSAGAKPRRIAAGEAIDQARVSGITWSPDSRRLAFLSSGTSSQNQIFCDAGGWDGETNYQS